MSDFRHRAACRNVTPELFFPIAHGQPAQAQIRRAKAVCGRCPVRAECLDYALEQGLDHGIFGGFTADERRAQHRKTVRPRVRI